MYTTIQLTGISTFIIIIIIIIVIIIIVIFIMYCTHPKGHTTQALLTLLFLFLLPQATFVPAALMADEFHFLAELDFLDTSDDEPADETSAKLCQTPPKSRGTSGEFGGGHRQPGPSPARLGESPEDEARLFAPAGEGEEEEEEKEGEKELLLDEEEVSAQEIKIT
jgi:hypothetical protein